MCRILLCACAHGVTSKISLDTGTEADVEALIKNK